MAQEAYYNNNSWQWMHPGGMYPHASLQRQGMFQPWNIVSQQRALHSNDFAMSQEVHTFYKIYGILLHFQLHDKQLKLIPRNLVIPPAT